MNDFQNKFGEPSETARTKVRDYMVPWVQEYVRCAPFAVLATSNADGDCDASPKGGKPGFIKVLNDRQLLIPDVAGNRLFQGYTNVSSNPKAALLFLIPGSDVTARVNGRVTIVSREDLEERGVGLEIFSPDENARLLQGLLMDVDESYSHCPRALKFSKLWDTETIEMNRNNGFTEKRKPGT